ncbi:carbonic anhydrase 4 [Dendropsophus ebraccatus]|uniref:carbonic anhydrase 4 n=1 Tax=Dendropsophus ebraccatus TaxID=150705 RepID=UPI003831D666
MTLSCLLLSLCLYLSTSSAAEWCYNIEAKTNSACTGPSKWSDISGYEACGKSSQSPIHILTCEAEFDSKLKPFKFEGYDKEQECLLKNNGHSAELALDGHQTISGGGLSGTYTAKQLHFHWGSIDNPGSEHTLNGDKYPIELHVVHTPSAVRSEPAGGSTSGGYAVLGFFIEEGPTNENYNGLIKGFDDITNNGTNTTVSKVKLQDLIPKENLTLFYRYQGSLTTPPCDETVTWTVFAQTIKMDKTQIGAFYTKLKYKSGDAMAENFRPIQKRNGRKITTSGADMLLSQARYLLISLFVFFLTSIS